MVSHRLVVHQARRSEERLSSAVMRGMPDSDARGHCIDREDAKHT